ncbi:MAG: hypothetical protein JWL98_2187 [Xanthomonadaceae bacterium]|nr:hypothetical protein [Xanthomonadaceae bacterium]
MWCVPVPRGQGQPFVAAVPRYPIASTNRSPINLFMLHVRADVLLHLRWNLAASPSSAATYFRRQGVELRGC